MQSGEGSDQIRTKAPFARGPKADKMDIPLLRGASSVWPPEFPGRLHRFNQKSWEGRIHL